MAASTYGTNIMPSGAGVNFVAASASAPVQSNVYTCGNGVSGQGYGGTVVIRLYNCSTAPTLGCTGILFGKYTGESSSSWHFIAAVVGNLVAGTGSTGGVTTPPTLTGTTGAAAAVPQATSGSLAAGLTEVSVPFGPEWGSLMVSFLGNTGASVSVDAWVEELETI